MNYFELRKYIVRLRASARVANYLVDLHLELSFRSWTYDRGGHGASDRDPAAAQSAAIGFRPLGRDCVPLLRVHAHRTRPSVTMARCRPISPRGSATSCSEWSACG